MASFVPISYNSNNWLDVPISDWLYNKYAYSFRFIQLYTATIGSKLNDNNQSGTNKVTFCQVLKFQSDGTSRLVPWFLMMHRCDWEMSLRMEFSLYSRGKGGNHSLKIAALFVYISWKKSLIRSSILSLCIWKFLEGYSIDYYQSHVFRKWPIKKSKTYTHITVKLILLYFLLFHWQ